MTTKLQTQNFQFEVLLGTGTFGKVYLVKRKKDGKQFVIKEQEQSLNNVWVNKMISAEVGCLQILRHPNIVSYYGAWQEDSRFFILLEYASRGTLRNLLEKRTAPLEEKDALYLFAQVVLGVHHIHSKNILHRDLKPDNIMLTGKMGDIVKIGDFGLSKDLRDNSWNHAGSFYYIAPEMLKKEAYDFKCDIWSMGVVLYEMLTKQLVFPATDTKEMIDLICHKKPRSFGKVQVSLSSKIMVYKMLMQDPAKRPTTKLLLLYPALVPFIAKVYLNLGRAYATPLHEFGVETFQNYLNTYNPSVSAN